MTKSPADTEPGNYQSNYVTKENEPKLSADTFNHFFNPT